MRSELANLILLGIILVFICHSMGKILSIIPPIVAPFLIFVGFGLVVVGLRKCWDLQIILDSKDIAITGQEEHKLEYMTNEDIENDRVVDLQYDEETLNL